MGIVICIEEVSRYIERELIKRSRIRQIFVRIRIEIKTSGLSFQIIE